MAIVISNDDLQAAEDFFYLAMISSKTIIHNIHFL